MPSPLNGLIVPPASPVTSHVGPAWGPTDMPIGRRPPVGGPQAVSGLMSHEGGAYSEKLCSRWVVLTAFHWLNVESSPIPTLMRPSPTGKIHPYPGRTLPALSLMSSQLSIQGSSWRGEVQ